MSVYQLQGGPTSTADDVSSLDVQFDGEIVAWAFEVSSGALSDDGDTLRGEVSFLSSSCFSSNDCRGVIASQSVGLGLTTSGAGPASSFGSLSGLRIPITAGERLHLHASLTGITASYLRCIIYVLDDADPRLRRRR